MKVLQGNIASPLGFSADGVHVGFKKYKMDFGWIVSHVPASVAGVYTTSKVIAAPLIVTRDSIKKAGKIRSGVITGGMIPKIESAVKTVESGVSQVVIGDSLVTGTAITAS